MGEAGAGLGGGGEGEGAGDGDRAVKATEAGTGSAALAARAAGQDPGSELVAMPCGQALPPLLRAQRGWQPAFRTAASQQPEEEGEGQETASRILSLAHPAPPSTRTACSSAQHLPLLQLLSLHHNLIVAFRPRS